jgi:hypothetical protein
MLRDIAGGQTRPRITRRPGRGLAENDITNSSSGALFNSPSDHAQPIRYGCPGEIDELRFRRTVARLHRLGPRATAELLSELGARYLIRTPIKQLLDAYLTRLDPWFWRCSVATSLRRGRSGPSRNSR